ncbi:MAG: DUF6036 family nucleotidyltransferase, partial [Thermodesulfobacteriota bacterium]
LFNANNVEYLVIGGYALIQYAEPRYTKDLDLWISTDPENASAVYHALQQFGAPLNGLTQSDFSENGFFYQMGVPPVRVDILMGIPGVQFREAWERRETILFDDLPVFFISRQDLITVKRSSGRPQDLIDADLLSQSNET